MGVYIKNFEIPKDCMSCNAKQICGAFILELEKRRDDCPLVEISTPHGRLIDADRVNDYIIGSVDLRDVPTVIDKE